MRAWYLVYSKLHQERVALENLTRQGYASYVPMMRNRRRRRERRVSVIEPMFPRYLFVRLSDTLDDWGPIRSTRGVMRLVRFGTAAAVVPDTLIETLREREGDDGVQVLPEHEFKPGERVRICEGAMQGYEAIFSARSGKQRVLLLLEIAGKTARVMLDADGIEPVSRGQIP